MSTLDGSLRSRNVSIPWNMVWYAVPPVVVTGIGLTTPSAGGWCLALALLGAFFRFVVNANNFVEHPEATTTGAGLATTAGCLGVFLALFLEAIKNFPTSNEDMPALFLGAAVLIGIITLRVEMSYRRDRRTITWLLVSISILLTAATLTAFLR